MVDDAGVVHGVVGWWARGAVRVGAGAEAGGNARRVADGDVPLPPALGERLGQGPRPLIAGLRRKAAEHREIRQRHVVTISSVRCESAALKNTP